MAAAEVLLTISNPVLKAYLFHVAVLGLKMLLMSPLTARQRFKHKIFISPEDTASMKGAKVKYDHPDIERVRRGHQNDLENITVFFIVALAYLLTNPSPGLAINLFRAFTTARIGHTIVYCVIPIPQPTRFLFFFVGWAITFFMAGSVVLHCL
ncbi:microsomal glutathione S-transferase 1-like [Schistocerca serialis cubense]|uniref:microsomal glutathione S-transferase 1-like n=1 Tax=Schistocerca serialis cubense TaxID=2023355 RepID=UPI00214E6512|nr:microsomal glutathione S-transferase 1-like [Schistocerca serialis cubense]